MAGLTLTRLEPRDIPATPTDPLFPDQWGLTRTTAPAAWDVFTGTGATVVAVIDSGIDLSHPDLAANLWTNPGETPGNGVDDDGNGFVDDVHGYDFANDDANPTDDYGHGTHVAGIIGAVGDNGVGTAGILWTTRLMAVKVLDAAGDGPTAHLVRAVDYAVANGAKVICMSLGGGEPADELARAIDRARAAGRVVVAAAGNERTDLDAETFYPAGYAALFDNVVAVASVDQADALAATSNFGAQTVTLAAPGVSILSTVRGGGTGTKSGTSMAAPFVAGAAALVWDAHPTWTYQQVIAAVTSTIDPVPALADVTVTGGVLNLARALAATPAVPPPVNPSTGPRVTVGAFVETTTGAFTRVRLSFDEPIQGGTFTASDVVLTGPTGVVAVTGITVVPGSDGRTFDLRVSAAVAGLYTLTVGPDVRDGSNRPMNQNGNGVNGEAADRYVLTATLVTGASATENPPLAVSPPPPPAAPPPPAVPLPPPITPTGFAVGSGPGLSPATVAVYDPSGVEARRFTPFAGFGGGVRVASADFNGDGILDVVAAAGPGIAARVAVIDGATGQTLYDALAFEEAFTGGLNVAAGDLTGDGTPDLVLAPDEGGGPRVRVLDGRTFAAVADFYGIDDPGFRGGCRVAVGDVTGDGRADLVVAAGFGGGPRVAVWDGASLRDGAFTARPFADFFAFEQGLRNGAYVAAGDVTGDGRADLILGGGPGGAPRVRVADAVRLSAGDPDPVESARVADFYAGSSDDRGGVRVTVADLDGDGLADVVAGVGGRVTVYPGVAVRAGTPAPVLDFDPFPGFTGGVSVG